MSYVSSHFTWFSEQVSDPGQPANKLQFTAPTRLHLAPIRLPTHCAYEAASCATTGCQPAPAVGCHLRFYTGCQPRLCTAATCAFCKAALFLFSPLRLWAAICAYCIGCQPCALGLPIAPYTAAESACIGCDLRPGGCKLVQVASNHLIKPGCALAKDRVPSTGLLSV